MTSTDSPQLQKGYYEYTYEALSKRAADIRNRIFALSATHAHIVLVTHGAIAHFITEDWDVGDPMTETAYRNCEVREFGFTAGSTGQDAHLEELEESKKTRKGGEEEDEHVMAELEGVVG
jgi:broad specificity phosphatase PhoE